MNLIHLTTLFFLIATTLAYGSCSGYHPEDYLQSGVVQFVNSYSSKTSCVTVQINYKVPSYGFETAVSTNDLSGYRPKSGLDYSIRAGRKDDKNLLALSLIVEDKSWKKISVSYLVSSRKDIYLGSFIADVFSIFGCDSSKVDTGLVSYTIHDLPPSKFKYNVQLFISGIKTDDGSANINIWEPRVNSNNGLLTFNLKSNANPSIQNIHISYVIWGKVEFEIFTFSASSKSGSDYEIIGVVEFKKSYASFLGLALDFDRIPCVGSGCKSSCTTVPECKKNYGKLINDTCFLCGENEKIESNKCVPKCGLFQILKNGKCVCQDGYIKLGYLCKFRCGINEIWKNGKCVCKPEHAKLNGVCKPCPPNSWASADDSRCICKKNYNWNEKTSECDKVDCPPYSSIVYQKNVYKCECNKGYQWYRDRCVKDCGKNEVFQNGKCVCEDGYIKLGYICKFRCGINEIWKNGKCVCKAEHAKIEGVCRPCPPNSWPSSDGTQCVCKKNYNWNPKTRQCDEVRCPPYSRIVYSNYIYKCECNKGYEWVKGKCIPACDKNEVWKNGKCVCREDYVFLNNKCTACPANSWVSADGKACECKKNYYWNSYNNTCDYLICGDYSEVKYINYKYVCKCIKGYKFQYGKCKPVQTGFCPPRSRWNQKKLQCECTYENQYLIDYECKPCGKNEGWNGEECVCRTGFYKIKGVCRTCNPNSYYNGVQCICNHGYFGDGEKKCERCHETCGKCSGPWAKDCITCSDVSYDLVGGVCKRKTPCPTGLYLNGKQCKPCSSYCSDCTSENICDKCIKGFKLETLSLYGQKASFCSQICGDGRRYEVDCDDGNTKDGDGCNSKCEVEKGYTCQGGSSVKPSQCVSFAPSRSYIALKGTVHLYGKIVQGVRMTYIPPKLTKNECAECSKLLWVRVIDSEVVPGVRIKYLPGSKYQFLAEFQFHGLFAVPVFSVSFQINPDYSKFFNEADMAQIKIKTIDPALLKKKENIGALSLDDDDANVAKDVFNND